MKTLLSVCFLLLSNILPAASTDNPLTSRFVNGTLAITVAAAPAPGLPAPKILVTKGFTIYQQNVNWGDTWNLNIPSGTYRIQPLPVTDGTNIYTASTVNISVPPSTTTNVTVTYQ